MGWASAERLPDGYAPAPPRGTRVQLPALAATLRAIAETGPDVVCHGHVADAIAAATHLTGGDLAAYRPRWVTPLRPTLSSPSRDSACWSS